MRARRRQRERAIGIGVVVLGVVVLVVAVLALREPKGHVSSESGTQQTKTIVSTVTSSPARSSSTSAPRSSSSSSSAPGSSSASSSKSPAGVKSVPLIVLNSTTIANVAGDATRKLRSDGWTVSSFDSIENNIISTCAYYDPSVPGAKAAAQALRDQYPWIKRVKERFAELPKGPVVLVLTRPYTQG